jgi:anaerobic ribonucleoside-triphosphate reductase
MVDGVTRCPKCGEFVCPDCGAHDVMPISRITGYMSPIAEWNAGKRKELEDRVRTDGL